MPNTGALGGKERRTRFGASAPVQPYLAGQPDRRPGRLRIVAVNGTHRLPDALAPLINVRSGAEGDKLTPNVTKLGTTFGTYPR